MPVAWIRRTFGALLATAALSLAFASGAWAAKPVHVSCGEIITTDTKLANDLVDCPRHGILIGAPDITLDLNGHTIDGDDLPFEPCPLDEPCDVGIVNSGIRAGTAFNGSGYDDVTIKNGAVKEFAEVGVYLLETRNNRVSRLQTSKSDFESDGVHLTACTHCRIEDSSASAYSVGFVVTRSHDVRVRGNVAHDNRFAGVLVAESERVTVARNAVSDHPEGDGIVLLADSDHNVVRENSLLRNAAGVGIQNSRENLVTRNVLRDNRFAGAYVLGADANRIEQNVVVANGDGIEGGIHVLSDEQANSSDENSLTGNLLSANVGDGILVDAGQTGTLIERNLASRNTDDGIDVDSAATTLRRNIATRNGDLGIEAVPGVVDGGGNRASGNGNPLQCTHVVCR